MSPRPFGGVLKEYSSTFNVLFHVGDWLVIAVSGWIAHWYYLGSPSLRDPYEIALLVAVLLAALVFPRFNVYRAWRGASLLDELRLVTLAWGAVVVAMVFVAFITKMGETYSRGWALIWMFVAWFGLLGSRVVLRQVLSWMRERGYNQRRIVIVGARGLGKAVAERISAAPWVGLKIAGFFCNEKERGEKVAEDFPVIGGLDELAEFVEREQVDQVWLAMPLKEEAKMRRVLHDLRHATVDIRFVPDVFAFRLINHSITEVAGLPVMNLSVSPMQGLNRVIKGLEDRMLALLILVLISPLLLVVGMGVKFSSPGPVFYRQERVSWNGQRFEMLKFRSMRADAERDGVKWGNAHGKPVTKWGAFLRRTSLDELPQFINVLKGEMSIVGPRPERPMFVEKFKDEIPDYMKKHLVKAGITGWAQVNGFRGDTDLKKRIEYDLYYIEHWSVWFDLKIIFLTIFKGFFSSKAY